MSEIPLTARGPPLGIHIDWCIRSTMTCESINVIYVIECKTHQVQYVGKTTTTLRKRAANHRSSIACRYQLPVAQHFNSREHSPTDFIIQPIEQVTLINEQSNKILDRESYWMFKLETIAPKGLNPADKIYF